MKNSNKIFNKIKSEIYKESEGNIDKEQAFNNIRKIMDIRNLIDTFKYGGK